MHVREFIEKHYPEYYGWFDYPAAETVSFCKADREWGILGNFGRTPLLVDGVPFENAEKLFQVIKFSDAQSRRDVYSRRGQTIKMTAKHREKVGTVREDWGRILVDALKFCLMCKYEQSTVFREELARTGGRFIVEEQAHPGKAADTYSARLSPDGLTWSGPNLMGRLLMELRDRGRLDYRLPEDAVSFADLK